MSLLSISNIAFTILGYEVSYIELFATVTGLLSVYFASRANILTWPTGILNEFGFFIIFFQIQLFADMFLQVYFFIVTIYGWLYWKQDKKELVITTMSSSERKYVGLMIVFGSLLLGLFISNIHLLAPSIFTKPASFAYVDSLTTVMSVIAIILLARKKLESWLLWISVDIISLVIYFKKGVSFIAIEYVIFLLIATYGYFNWRKRIA